MNNIAIKINNLSKQYSLGAISTGTLVRDISSFYARLTGKEDPNSIVSGINELKLQKKGSIWALKDVNLNLNHGEILGIIGKNGAGKSTLLKILARITAPTTGEVKIRGRLASLLEVGTGFHPELTGRENIFLNGAILGMNKNEIKNKLERIIDFSEIQAYIDTPVKRYSTGMKVRLAFSVAAHLDPEILLIDEVLAVGDASFQDKCLNKMNSISEQGRTILFVSHQLQWINELCDRCILIDKGRVKMDGSPKEVIGEYLKGTSQENNDGTIMQPGKNSEYNKGELEVLNIELIGEDNQIKSEFYFKEKITVKILLEIKKDLKNCNINIMIGDLRGKIILYSDSGSVGSFNNGIKKGKHVSITQIQSNMLPGIFSIYIGVGKENGQTLEWLERVLDFKVLKIGKNPSSNFRWDTVHGLVNDDSIWEIKESSDNEIR
ncbi:MAG: ABC transporter ATP-binding protein [Candidatus Neomarinimicrobiota bacterium]